MQSMKTLLELLSAQKLPPSDVNAPLAANSIASFYKNSTLQHPFDAPLGDRRSV